MLPVYLPPEGIFKSHKLIGGLWCYPWTCLQGASSPVINWPGGLWCYRWTCLIRVSVYGPPRACTHLCTDHIWPPNIPRWSGSSQTHQLLLGFDLDTWPGSSHWLAVEVFPHCLCVPAVCSYFQANPDPLAQINRYCWGSNVFVLFV